MRLRPYQQEAVAAVFNAFEAANAALIVMPTGCHAVGQRLLRYDGEATRVEDFHLGDILVGPDSGPRPILAIHRGTMPLYRITPVKGTPFVVTSDHRLTLVRTPEKTRRRDRGGEIVDVSVAEWLTWPKYRKHVHKLFRVGMDFGPGGQAPRRRQKDVLRTGIASVDYVGVGDYVGFTVAGDNRYLLDDFTVTHNCGKTQIFCSVAERMTAAGRVMILAHREELIWQAANRYQTIAGDMPDIEMAEMQARKSIFDRSRVVVSSIQTQNAGERGDGRMTRFNPDEFSLLIVDECHHAPTRSYKRVIRHYSKNENLKILGVTATPDRADEKALGQIFEAVAYDYELPDAIRDGWLVPIEQRAVHVEGLDYSSIPTTKAGDLNGARLSQILEYEANLHGIAHPTMELIGDRKALVFAASVAHAERLCEIFNRHSADCARWVCGKTPKDERRAMFRDYAAKRFQILCNVGVATEGFDDPSIEVVVMARPTKSRALYAQCVGRGTRTLPGLIEDVEDPDERRLVIATSAKPIVEVLDFVGNSGRHKLVSTADLLGGRYDDAVVERAKKAAEDAGEAGRQVDMIEELEAAQREIEAEAERERRRKLKLRARYSTSTVDPFDVLHIRPWKERGWDKGRQPSEKMVDLLERNGIYARNMSFARAHQLIQEIIRRRKQRRPTYKQTRLLQKYGYEPDVSFEEAGRLIDAIRQAGWRRPETVGV